MAVYFTSDLHIGHRLVCDLRGFCHGPDCLDPACVRAHDDRLAENWDALVKSDDQIWVLGDISAGGTKAQAAALEWVKARPGHKHLIAGNHDGCHPMHRSSHKMLPLYLEAFESVQMAAVRRVFMADGSVRRVLVSHFPFTGDHTIEGDRYDQWRLPDRGLPILHGHTHSDKVLTKTEQGSLQVHVGLDAHNLRPVSLERVAELLQ